MENSSLKSKIKKLRAKIIEHGRFAFYYKLQTYQIRYSVTIKNQSSILKNITTIIPLPQNTYNQGIKSVLVPRQMISRRDEKYSNTYSLWSIDLKAGESRTVDINSQIEVNPHPLTAKAKTVTLDDYDKISAQYKLYTAKNSYIDGDNPQIQEIADSLSSGERNVYILLNRINEYVIQNTTYGDPISGLYTYQDALTKKQVDCGGFATFFASLCISLGIPARVVSGFWVGYPEEQLRNKMHAWVEVLLPGGTWINADPSTEKLQREQRTNLFGKLDGSTSDRIIFSVGSEIPLKIENKKINIDILQNPTTYPADKEILTSLNFTAVRIQ